MPDLVIQKFENCSQRVKVGAAGAGLRHRLMVGLLPALKSRESKQSSCMHACVALCPAV